MEDSILLFIDKERFVAGKVRVRRYRNSKIGNFALNVYYLCEF